MATPAQPPKDPNLENLLYHARDPRAVWRDQYGDDENPGPSLAPGWNTLSVLDMLKSALLATASESMGNINPKEVTLTDEDLETHMPGLKEMAKEAVDCNIPSEVLHRALLGEAQYLARQVIGYMTPEQREALLACAKSKLQD